DRAADRRAWSWPLDGGNVADLQVGPAGCPAGDGPWHPERLSQGIWNAAPPRGCHDGPSRGAVAPLSERRELVLVEGGRGRLTRAGQQLPGLRNGLVAPRQCQQVAFAQQRL